MIKSASSQIVDLTFESSDSESDDTSTETTELIDLSSDDGCILSDPELEPKFEKDISPGRQTHEKILSQPSSVYSGDDTTSNTLTMSSKNLMNSVATSGRSTLSTESSEGIQMKTNIIKPSIHAYSGIKNVGDIFIDNFNHMQNQIENGTNAVNKWEEYCHKLGKLPRDFRYQYNGQKALNPNLELASLISIEDMNQMTKSYQDSVKPKYVMKTSVLDYNDLDTAEDHGAKRRKIFNGPIMKINSNYVIVDQMYQNVKTTLENLIIELFQPTSIKNFAEDFSYLKSISSKLNHLKCENLDVSNFFELRSYQHEQVSKLPFHNQPMQNKKVEIELIPKDFKEIWLIKNLVNMLLSKEINYVLIYEYNLEVTSFKEIFNYVVKSYFPILCINNTILTNENLMKHNIPKGKQTHDQHLDRLFSNLTMHQKETNLTKTQGQVLQVFIELEYTKKRMNPQLMATEATKTSIVDEPFYNAQKLGEYRQKLRVCLHSKDYSFENFKQYLLYMNDEGFLAATYGFLGGRN